MVKSYSSDKDMQNLDRTTPPPLHPVTDLRLAAPRQRTLPNGIPTFLFDNDKLDLIHIIVTIRTGVLYEQTKHTALFAYALLKESSPDRTSEEMSAFMDFYGAYLTVSETLDRTTMLLTVPKRNVTTVLPAVCRCMTSPHYREENIERYKQLKIKDLEYNSQKSDVRNTQLMLHTMFGDGHTAGQFSTRENLQSVTIEEIAAFHRSTFCSENLSLFVTGNLSGGTEACICDLFAQVRHGQAALSLPLIPMPADRSSVIAEEMSGSVQSSITLCMPCIGYMHPDRQGFSILSTVLGGYFGSRLMQNLRERNGYTYGVSSGSVYFGSQSLFIINSDVNAAHTQDALDACIEETERLRQMPVGNEELESACNYLLGEMLRSVENSVSYTKKYTFWHHHGTDEREFTETIRLIRSITAEKLQTLAQKYFECNNFTRIVVGKTDNLKSL
jgi:zinc protease